MINNIYIALIPLRIYIFHKNSSLQFIYKLANLIIKIFLFIHIYHIYYKMSTIFSENSPFFIGYTNAMVEGKNNKIKVIKRN